MKRVVVTGLGFISSIGNSRSEVLAGLRETRNGIEIFPPFDRPEVPSLLAGTIKEFTFPTTDPDDWEYPAEYELTRSQLRPMGPNCLYGYAAMVQAITDAGLDEDCVSNPRTGLLCASGGSTWLQHNYVSMMLERSAMRTHPMGMVASIAGSLNFNLASLFKIRGASLGFSSACSSSSHAIGSAIDQIRLGRQDIVFAVGAEDCNFLTFLPFAGIRTLTTATNPESSPCAFDRNRDGFAPTGGGAVLVLEEMEHALERGATIYAELPGWGQASDGFSVMAPHPDGDGIRRAMELALEDAGMNPEEIDYLNAHGTATRVGDSSEMKAVRAVFGGAPPKISSTKSITGHGLSLAGALEAAICCLAIREGVIPASAKISKLDPEFEGLPIVTAVEHGPLRQVLSNSCAFGGSNVSIALQQWLED